VHVLYEKRESGEFDLVGGLSRRSRDASQFAGVRGKMLDILLMSVHGNCRQGQAAGCGCGCGYV